MWGVSGGRGAGRVNIPRTRLRPSSWAWRPSWRFPPTNTGVTGLSGAKWLSEEVMPGSVPRPAGAYDPGFVLFRLSAPAMRRGADLPRRDLGEMAERASWRGLAVLMVALCVAIPRDARAVQERREGRVLRG